MLPENDADGATDATDGSNASDRSAQAAAPGERSNGQSANGGVDTTATMSADSAGSAPGAGSDTGAAHNGTAAASDSVAGEKDTAPGVASVSSTGAGSDSDAGSVAGDGEAGIDTDESVESLQARLAIAEDQAAANWDRLLRLQADVENQRKRAQRELVNARKFALEGIVGDLLPIRDSLEMGNAAAQAEGGSIEKLLEGTDLTIKMLAQAFEKHGIAEINPVDEKFNPEFHEAMSMQEVEGKATNTVTAVLQKGYTLNERLIRPALVMVAR